MRRNPTTETTATMRKMKMLTVAARPYCAPWPPKAIRYVYVMSRSVAPACGLYLVGVEY